MVTSLTTNGFSIFIENLTIPLNVGIINLLEGLKDGGREDLKNTKIYRIVETLLIIVMYTLIKPLELMSSIVFHLLNWTSQAGLAPMMCFWVSSALNCSLYRWHLFVYFTFSDLIGQQDSQIQSYSRKCKIKKEAPPIKTAV